MLIDTSSLSVAIHNTWRHARHGVPNLKPIRS